MVVGVKDEEEDQPPEQENENPENQGEGEVAPEEAANAEELVASNETPAEE